MDMSQAAARCLRGAVCPMSVTIPARNEGFVHKSNAARYYRRSDSGGT